MREIRGFDRTERRPSAGNADGRADDGVATGVSVSACEALFGFWRATVMGHHGSSRRLAPDVAGYFFTGDALQSSKHRPLGEVRRLLLALLDHTDLTDDERTVIRLHHGLDGLPLPYSSKDTPDIAAGRDESSPRGTCRAGLAKVARHVDPRPLAHVPDRPAVDPLTEPWFRAAVPAGRRRHVVARAWVRAMSQCDGPHGPPTAAALRRWYELCGYTDRDLQPTEPASPVTDARRRPRPNANARHRAAALMEIALYEEVRALSEPARVAFSQLPAPRPGPPDSARLPETVTHPLLTALLTEELSPDELVAAAAVLQDLALNGVDVSGRTSLFLRCVRPRVHTVTGHRLERLAVSMSYVAATRGDPFLALEWLGVFLSRVGITDRTFTVMVNTIEAAAEGGYHKLAVQADRLFGRLQGEWSVPGHQLPFVEHFEAEQQRLAARAFRLERLGRAQARAGDVGRSAQSLQRSIAVASCSSRMAERALIDRSTFPVIELDGKAGVHGGDLTWTWALAAAACIVEPLDRLHAEVIRRPGGDPGADVIDLGAPARLARSLLDDYEGPLDCNRFRGWHQRVDEITARVLATAD